MIKSLYFSLSPFDDNKRIKLEDNCMEFTKYLSPFENLRCLTLCLDYQCSKHLQLLVDEALIKLTRL